MARLSFHEPSTTLDPLTLLLMEEEADDECDILASQYESGTHRTSTVELERTEH